ncbi:recombinase-like zinc beta ribbon protein [Natranaerovirga pectinivora]|uniref:Recombinase-like zinc beta ribbon protein n=1 Tax=Natranaerovirga pectinivora TaxID=682400 RepID=A0A4R3MNZ6_9FIRM|nr:recombinase-like zinc beta ribbon protein [Natranaerovirga pectinivora]
MERRKNYVERYGLTKIDYSCKENPFAGKVICGCCGSIFGRKVWNSTDERLRRYIWRCNRKYEIKGKKACDNKHIDDKVLYEAFINTFNMVLENKDYFKKKWEEHLDSDDLLKKYKAKQFIEIIEKAEPLVRFDADLLNILIEKMVVFDGGMIILSLMDGAVIECKI